MPYLAHLVHLSILLPVEQGPLRTFLCCSQVWLPFLHIYCLDFCLTIPLPAILRASSLLPPVLVRGQSLVGCLLSLWCGLSRFCCIILIFLREEGSWIQCRPQSHIPLELGKSKIDLTLSRGRRRIPLSIWCSSKFNETTRRNLLGLITP